MLLLAAVATGLYLLLAAGAVVLVGRTPPAPDVPDDALPSATVIVAARDEEDALPDCLHALLAQDYPIDRIEFIVADDHSTDATSAIVRRGAEQDERVRLVQVSDHGDTALRGKARALHAAIEQAQGDVLLITDADCRPNRSWARHLAGHFVEDRRAGVVCGVTTVDPIGWLGVLQQIDWLLLLGTSSAASRAGLPLTAMGNNMAIRRDAYEAVGGYPALPPSVTEDYQLFQAVNRNTPLHVHLLAQRELRVVTQPVETLRDAFIQRRRWARGGLRARAWVYAFYVAVLATHALLVSTLLFAPLATLPVLASKLVADATIIRMTAWQTGTTVRWRVLPFYEIALFTYVLAMPVALALAPRIRWKDRLH